MAEQYSSVCVCVCVCDIFFIRSRISEHLGGFHVLAAVKSAAVNSQVPRIFELRFSQRYMLSTGLAGSYGSFYS